MNDLLPNALAYGKHGFSIIPIQPCEKKPLIRWDSYQNQRANVDELRIWWTQWPDANVGIVTGAVSGLIVIDLDTLEAKERLKALVPDFNLAVVPRSRTGKGWQLFFKHPGVNIPNRAGVIPGLDVRGDGGYVVAPPSIHPNGKTYKWEVAINGELPKLPLKLFNLISSSTSNDQPGYRERFNTAGALAGVTEGQRDETIFRLACRLRSADVPQGMAETLVLEAARNCGPPFSASIALEKIERAYRKYEPNSREEKAIRTSHFSLIQAKDLIASEEPETEWLLEGILPAGGLSLLVAKPKVGKTTLAFNLGLAVAGGRDFLARKTKQSPVVYLALEEKRSEIRKKLKALGETPEGMSFHFGSAPEKAIQEVRNLIKETMASLLIVDVLQKFCRIKDLNDYAQVTNTLEPLMAMAREENCHILLTHHAGKADRQDGDDILGSTALLGGVDTLVQIKKRDKRRTFFTIQRYGEDIPETVIELKADGALEAAGTRQEVELEETIPLVVEVCDKLRSQKRKSGSESKRSTISYQKRFASPWSVENSIAQEAARKAIPTSTEKFSLLLPKILWGERGENPKTPLTL